MATSKTVNYTPEQTAQAIADYAAGLTVESIATKLGKTTRSIVAKLSREGVYKAKEYTTKKGEKPIAKEKFVEQIANVLGVSADQLGGLEKANKSTLELIFKGLVG